jgi:hypothetical protein
VGRQWQYIWPRPIGGLGRSDRSRHRSVGGPELLLAEKSEDRVLLNEPHADVPSTVRAHQPRRFGLYDAAALTHDQRWLFSASSTQGPTLD